MTEDLQAAELISAGGTWGAVLFDNPSIGYAPSLHWVFTFEFQEIERDYGSTGCHLSVDWVRLPLSDWRSMPATTITCTEFSNPIESSVYFFAHHRFGSVVLTLGEQRGRRLHVTADVGDDVDDLGIGSLHAEGWLDFDCLIVALSEERSSVDAARATLASFTSADGLEGVHTGHNYRLHHPSGRSQKRALLTLVWVGDRWDPCGCWAEGVVGRVRVTRTGWDQSSRC